VRGLREGGECFCKICWLTWQKSRVMSQGGGTSRKTPSSKKGGGRVTLHGAKQNKIRDVKTRGIESAF